MKWQYTVDLPLFSDTFFIFYVFTASALDAYLNWLYVSNHLLLHFLCGKHWVLAMFSSIFWNGNLFWLYFNIQSPCNNSQKWRSARTMYHVEKKIGTVVAVEAWLCGSWIYNCLCNRCLSVSPWVYLIIHYVLKFVSDLWQVGGFLRVLWFPPLIKLPDTI